MMLRNAMRAQAAMVAQERQGARLGQISAYDPNTYSVKVQFPPDSAESGWIPVVSTGVGNGWGICVGPTIGDQVALIFQDENADAGVAVGRLFDNQNMPPAVPSGEVWLVHKSGAYFKMTNAGIATFSDNQGAAVTCNGNGTITSTGTWTHQGAMTVQDNFTVQGATKVAAIQSNGHDISSTHEHTGVTSGSEVSGPPQ